MVIFLQQADIFGLIGEDFDEERSVRRLRKVGHCCLQFVGIVYGGVAEATGRCPSLGSRRVPRGNEAMRPFVHL